MKQKVQIEKEVTICNICQKPQEDFYSACKCLNCGATYCLFHSHEYGTTYFGSNLRGFIPNGYFCKDCDNKFLLTDDPVHAFYRKLEQFAGEFEKFMLRLDDFRDEYTILTRRFLKK